ncbi:MAG: ATP-binding protein [Calditrichaeota bacterium]|nr:ATP-binding protein [Calditrichota bacterium]
MLPTILQDYNPHWQRKKQRALKLIPRPFYLEQMQTLWSRPEILVVQGIRRSGKSSLMRLAIKNLLQNGVAPANVCLVNLEDYRLEPYLNPEGLTEILYTYRQMQHPTGQIFFFIDEIQRASRFEQWLRTQYELSPEIKFIISGSTSHIFSREMATLLTGRHLGIEVYPFSFAEYVAVKKPELMQHLQKVSIAEREIDNLASEIQPLLQRYLRQGGFPEILKHPFNTEALLLLQHYFQDILFKDIALRHHIRKMASLLELGRYLITNMANEVKVLRIAHLLNLHRATVLELFNYFNEVYLLFFTTNFSFSLNERLNTKKPRKVYCVDNGFYTALSATHTSDVGRLAENLVFQHLKFQWKEEVFFWKEKVEIDFVLSDGTPINVTTGDNIPEREYNGLFYYLEKHNLKKGIMVTRNHSEMVQESGRRLQLIPLWLFLLLPSKEQVMLE